MLTGALARQLLEISRFLLPPLKIQISFFYLINRNCCAIYSIGLVLHTKYLPALFGLLGRYAQTCFIASQYDALFKLCDVATRF